MEVKATEIFNRWFDKVNNRIVKAAVLARISKIEETGNLGSYKRVGNVSEFRFDVGPGYRVYFTTMGQIVVILLLGGDKGSQERDFKRAHELADLIKQEGFDG